MPEDKTYDTVLGFRCPPDIAAALDGVAEKEDRSRTAQIVRYIREGLKRDGALAADR